MLNPFESRSMKLPYAISLLAAALLVSTVWAAEPPSTAKPAATATATKIAKASGANAHTVAEITSKAESFKDKTVTVRGQVAKYNSGIMGKNWIHLHDGSGSADKGTDDLLVTSTATTKLGDVITVSGVVHTNKDFGAGYTYKVLIEDATLQP